MIEPDDQDNAIQRMKRLARDGEFRQECLESITREMQRMSVGFECLGIGMTQMSQMAGAIADAMLKTAENFDRKLTSRFASALGGRLDDMTKFNQDYYDSEESGPP